MTAHRAAIAAAIRTELRALRGGVGFRAAEVPALDTFLALLGIPADGAGEPAWVIFARGKIGEREVPGPRHNRWIVDAWARLGAPWFVDDETPWCGNFVAQCMEAAGLPWPKSFARAKAWSTYGVALDRPALGAIGVKSRAGGGHVFIIVGETPDRRRYKVIEGNADNRVRLGDIAKTDVEAIRWPPGIPLPPVAPLTVLASGTIASSEA